MSTVISNIDKVRDGTYRITTSPKRQRKLVKRGDVCFWLEDLYCWAWEPRPCWYKYQKHLKQRPAFNLKPYKREDYYGKRLEG